MVLLALAAPALAGNISLQLTTRTEVRDDQLVVTLTAKNSGDEAAHAVTPVLSFRDQSVQGDVHPELPPNRALEATLTLPAADLGTGRWPYRVMVGYADANGYPLHALHVAMLTVGNVPPGKVHILEASAEPLASSGALDMRVKNLGSEPRRVRVDAHLPDGIEARALPPLDLAKYDEQQVSVPLVNRTALPGSRYAVFVSAEYEDGDVHHAVIVPTVLEIIATQSMFRRQRTVLWALAALLVVGWVGVLVWRLAARRRAAAGSRS
jgi:hypothetical protein